MHKNRLENNPIYHSEKSLSDSLMNSSYNPTVPLFHDNESIDIDKKNKNFNFPNSTLVNDIQEILDTLRKLNLLINTENLEGEEMTKIDAINDKIDKLTEKCNDINILLSSTNTKVEYMSKDVNRVEEKIDKLINQSIDSQKFKTTSDIGKAALIVSSIVAIVAIINLLINLEVI